jgi:iron complex outermembrane receptor protein
VAFGNSRAFQEPAFSPDWTARFGARYVFDLGQSGELELNGAARYRSRMALTVDNTLTNSAVELPGMFQDEYWLYDANVTWRPTDILSVALVGRNLSDEVYRTDAQEFSSVGNIRTAYYGAPRTWSLVFTARY